MAVGPSRTGRPCSRITQEFAPGRHPGVDICPYDARGRRVNDGQFDIVAATAGQVVYNELTSRGHCVVLKHAGPVAYTMYQHLSSSPHPVGTVVAEGQPLGIMGVDPLDGERVLHLHFEVWAVGWNTPRDPGPFLTRS